MASSSYTSRGRSTVARWLVLSLGVLLVGSTPRILGQSRAATNPGSDGAANVRLVGYNDLQGRQSLQITARSDAANGNWVYVGHSPNNRTEKETPQLNPITGQQEFNGTSILEISDPANPKLVWHIPGCREGQPSQRLGGLRLQAQLQSGRPRLPDSQLRHRQGHAIPDLRHHRPRPPIRRGSRWCPRSRARRPIRADLDAAGRSGTAPTRATGRRSRATTMPPPASPASATPRCRFSTSGIRRTRSGSAAAGCAA